MKYLRLIEVAKSLQPLYKFQKHFHLTFILRGSRIITFGVNNERKTNPRNLKFNYNNADQKGTHSELAAVIANGEEDCSTYTFFNIRIDKNGRVRYSMPCKGCQGLLEQVGYKRVFYSVDEDHYGEWKNNC